MARVIPFPDGVEYTVGVLVQANHGFRETLTIAGVPVGQEIPDLRSVVQTSARGASKTSSIVYVIDISGSMGWDMGQYTAPDGSTKTGCRLDRAKAELTKSVMSLPNNFKFNIVSWVFVRHIEENNDQH